MRIVKNIFLLFFSVLFSCNNFEKKEDEKKDTVSISNSNEIKQVFLTRGLINEIIPKGYSTTNKVFGHLNNDSLEDCAVIIKNDEEYDSKRLLVLLKNDDGTYLFSLNTSDYISNRYDNEISIKDKKLNISTDEPWHGSNARSYEFEFVNNGWVCNHASSYHGDPINSWSTYVDFIKGEFKISHVVHLLEKIEKTKEVKGKLSAIGPAPLSNNELSFILHVKVGSESYYLLDRNDLWSEEEILNELPQNYRLIIGLWTSEISDDLHISFEVDGTYTFNADNGEEFQGEFKLKNDSLLFEYPKEMQSMIFRIARLPQETVLVSNKNSTFYKGEKYDEALADTAQ